MAGKPRSRRVRKDFWSFLWRSYGITLLCVAIALGATLLLLPWLYPTTMPLFLVAVMVSAWHGGWQGGLLATVLSTLAVNYFFIEPFYSLQIVNLATVVRLGTFLTAALVISLLNQSRRRALKNAREALQALQHLTSQEQAASSEATTAKERLETVLSSINDGFYSLDQSWRITFVNDRYCEMVQMPASALLGQILWELFPAAIETEAYIQFHRAVREQVPLQFDYFYEPWNCWHDHRVYPSPLGLTVLIADITGRKQAEEALRQSRDRLAFVMRITEIGRWLNTMPLSALNWDDRTRELFFIPPGVEPTIELFWSRVHPDDREPTRLAIEAALREQTLYEIDHRAVNPETGEIRWIRSAGMATYADDGTPVRFDGINYDISDRKRAEQEREQVVQYEQVLRHQAEVAEAKLQQILASLREDFVLFDHNWQITYLNDPAAETMGLPRETALGSNMWDLFPELVGTEFYERLHQVMRDRTPIQFEYYYSTWDIWFENRVYSTPEGIVNLCTNITDRKRAELNEQFLNQLDTQLRQLSTAEAMVSVAVSSIGEFLNADRCTWDKIDWAADIVIVEQDWRRQAISSTVGTHRISTFILPDLAALFQQGRPAIASDVTTYAYTAAFADNLTALDIRAFLAVPCVKEGQWVATLVASASTVRPWRSDEVALLQAFVARLWPLIEQTRAVQELRQSEAEFRLLANAMPQIVYVSNADGVLEFVNDRWIEYTGMTLAQSRDLNSTSALMPADDREQLAADFLQARETRSPYQSQFRLVQPDGSTLSFLTRAIPVLDAQGQVYKWYGTSTDVTELKALEAELRQKNAILNVINESSPAPIFVKDLAGRIIFANPATLEVLGKSASEVIGYRDCDLYPNPEDAARVMENDRRIMESGQMEVVEESPDGLRTFLGMKVPYRNEAGEVIGLIGIANDISDRVQLERDRERLLQQEQAAREAAERANRIKDEFLAVVSHELRTPLNPILGWAQLLQRGKLSAEKTEKALATIERNAQLQSQLIDDLLDISRILRGKLSLNMLPVDLRAVVLSALETVQLAAEAKSIQIQTLFSSQVGAVVGDAGRLQQVVWNLLSNAVKFTPLQGQITVALTQTDTHAQIQVTDTGKGIHPDFVPHVFEHFRQEDGAITRQFGGLGLGLAIVKQIVELHGGSAAAQSLGEDQGATFTVQIPLAPQLIELPTVEAAANTTSNLEGIRILVVDDEPDSREFVAFVLEEAGARVTSVASAVEALQAIAQFIPDLVVSDIGMPDMDGYSLMQQIRAQFPASKMPAVALTAYAGEFDRTAAITAGFQQHISKPVNSQQLVSAISILYKEAFNSEHGDSEHGDSEHSNNDN